MEHKIIGIPSFVDISIDKLKAQGIFAVAVITMADTPSALRNEMDAVRQALAAGYPVLLLSRLLGIENGEQTINRVMTAIAATASEKGDTSAEFIHRALLLVCRDFLSYCDVSLNFVNTEQLNNKRTQEAILDSYVKAKIFAWEAKHGLLEDKFRDELVNEIKRLITTRPFTHEIEVEQASSMTAVLIAGAVIKLKMTDFDALTCLSRIVSRLLVQDLREMEQYVLWTQTESEIRTQMQCVCHTERCGNPSCTVCEEGEEAPEEDSGD